MQQRVKLFPFINNKTKKRHKHTYIEINLFLRQVEGKLCKCLEILFLNESIYAPKTSQLILVSYK